MEECNQLLAVLRNDAATQEWAETCAHLKAAFEKLSADAKAALVAGDDCVPALLHAIGRQGGSGGDDWAAVLCSACEALNGLITGLPKEVKQVLLSGEKGVVDALLRVLADARGKSAWGSVGFCFRNMFLDVAADVRQQLLSDGRGIVEAIAGVLDGDEIAAWASACGALSSFLSNVSASSKQSLLSGKKGFVVQILRVLGVSEHSSCGSACSVLSTLLTGVPPSAKSMFLLSQPQLIATIIARLENEDAHSSWRDSMGLLKRLVYQEASLSHINFCTLDFLKKDCGLMAVLLRCSRGFSTVSTDADNKVFQSVASAFEDLSVIVSDPPFIAISLEVVTLLVAAAQLCSYEPALRKIGLDMSNFSEDVNFCTVLAQAKCHEYALSKIAVVSAADSVWDDPWSVASCCLSVIVNMSRNDSLHNELKQARLIEVLSPLATTSCAAELRVLMALSYIIGCKESSSSSGSGSSSALTQLANSSSIGKIVDCLENTLNLRGGPGYVFGFIILPATLQVRMQIN